jgi:hypothetical protein
VTAISSFERVVKDYTVRGRVISDVQQTKPRHQVKLQLPELPQSSSYPIFQVPAKHRRKYNMVCAAAEEAN